MNVLAVLLVMIAIYGYYAIFDKRATREDGRAFAVGGWLVVSAAAIGLLAYQAGPAHVFDAHPEDLETFVLLLLPYGVLMTLCLQQARIVRVTTPALLVTHGMALAALADGHIAFLFGIGVAMTPVVLYAALRRKVGPTIRILAYVWCMVVFTAYTVRFIDAGLVQTDAVSTALLALPFLLVRLSSFAAVFVVFIRSDDSAAGTFLEDREMLLEHAQIERMALAVALGLPAAAAGVMLAALKVDQAGLAFVVLYLVGQELAWHLQPPAYRGRRWWQTA